ncbi:ribokinase [Listeria floridensis FSL S10-1187]|uniref:Ribokinase n=1 Tax=Listeria floridensis FSL S10-1187 TaxID=1265817 RepID=A0ABP3B215_9LIST|nr:ribokinase [Listeria floridensis]EUJ33204.1 ribokinase [Listeria floridensis FSL S10-1187]
MKQICVVGSLNLDTTLEFEALPNKGETRAAKELRYSAGGKGFNQAVTAKRLGSEVVFIGAVGNDERGQMLRAILEEEQIDQTEVQTVEAETGQAYIAVDRSGNNLIMTYGGANKSVTEAVIEQAAAKICASDAVIAQFEIPEPAIIKSFELAKQHDKLTILNPAPGRKCSMELLRFTDYLIPNETELEFALNRKLESQMERIEAARELLQWVRKAVIVTLGEAGSLFVTAEAVHEIPAVKADAVDTTAAGDSFIGTFAHYVLRQGEEDAIKRASLVAALVVAKQGAHTSIPSSHELNRLK